MKLFRPKLADQNLRMYRFLTQTPKQIQDLLANSDGVHPSMQLVVIAPNTSWKRTHSLPDIQTLFEFIHQTAPKAAIKICSFYTVPFKSTYDVMCANRFNAYLKAGCRPYTYVQFVDLDELARSLRVPAPNATAISQTRAIVRLLQSVVEQPIR